MPQPKDQRTRLDPEVRRLQIVEAAARAFRGRDPAEVTFEEIADAAGVSRALVYNYFGDRGGVLAAVYLHTFSTLNAELNATIPASLAPDQRLLAIVRGYLRFAVTHPEAWRLLHLVTGTSHASVVAARRAHMEALGEQWGGSPLARIAAAGVVGMLESSTFDWLETPDADLDSVAAVLYDLVWTGLSSLAAHGIVVPARRARESVPT